MAYKINISGEIGWDYTAQNILDSLKAAKGDDLDIDIATPGGDVFDGIEIYNAIRDYKRANPKSQISATLKGLVASMGTYIASNDAIDLVAAEDNAVYMVHNPWSVALGDYRDMQTSADMLKGLADILSMAYAKRTGKSDKDIRAMMDAETWIFGDDIKAAGFVDDMIPGSNKDTDNDKDKSKGMALAAARTRFDAMMSAQSKRSDHKRDSMRAAAIVRDLQASLPGQTGSNNIAPSQGGKEDNEVKNLSEFMAQGKEALAEVDAVKAEAIKAERARVGKLHETRAKFGKVGAIAELVDDAIATGKTFADISESVMALALAALDSPGNIDTGHKDTATGEGEPVALPQGYVPITVIK